MLHPDSELEDDEEEILVYVEFDNCATNDVFSSENLKLDMLGLDSDHPVMQVNGKFYEGTYEDAIGTYMFFEKDNNPKVDDPAFDRVPSLKFLAKTRKLLRMQRAFVNPRYEVVGDSSHSNCIPNSETLKEAGVPPRYQEEAISFWEDWRNKRIEALNEYLKKQELRKNMRLQGLEPESESDEDSPFAMYKFLEDKSGLPLDESHSVDINAQIKSLESELQMTELDNEEIELEEEESEAPQKSAEKVTQKLHVIDPGPSTSKSSMPWIEDDTSIEHSMTHKVRSVGRVRQRTLKGKVQKKTVRKRNISTSQKSLDDSSSAKSASGADSKIQDQSNRAFECLERVSKVDEKIRPIAVKTEDMEIDELAISIGASLLAEELKIGDSFIAETNRRKQERREAKMKEMSDRLKASSESSQLDS